MGMLLCSLPFALAAMRVDGAAGDSIASSRARRRWNSLAWTSAQCRVGGSTISRWMPLQPPHCMAQYSAPVRPLMTLRIVRCALHCGHRESTGDIPCQILDGSVFGLAMAAIRVEKTVDRR